MSVSNNRLSIIGGQPLVGTVRAEGAKNAALPILAACILTKGQYVIHNIPPLTDVITMVKMLNTLGLHVELGPDHQIKVWNERKIRHIAPYELVTAMRASFFVAGPILARTGFAKVPLPGGCAIGLRPLSIHLNGFRAMGVDVHIEHGFVQMVTDQLRGAVIPLDFPSVGATENIMMAATLADGITRIENAAKEPEVMDLAAFLVGCGAMIHGVGTDTITIQGVSTLNGCDYTVIPDRIEVGTLMLAAGITGGDVTIEGVVLDHIASLIHALQAANIEVSSTTKGVRVCASKGPVLPVAIETKPFPGFPTDMQAQMMAMLCLAKGCSTIDETIFENRFMHVNELMRMGANIHVNQQRATIHGVSSLFGAEVKMTDLRAGAALVLAGLAAKGETSIYGLHHLNRGYDNLPDKLRTLGASIQSR